MRFISAAAKPDERERWSFLMLQLGPHCLGEQTRMNISVRRSPWVPMVGAWHTYRHTHTHIHRRIHSLSWLPELFTSQSQMPQLSHQYRCVNDANCYAHWTIVQGLQCEHKYGSVAVLVCSWSLLFYENRCNEHPSLAACQETAQLAEQRSSLNLPQFLLSPRLPSLWLPFSPPLPDWKYSPPSVTSLVSSAFLNGALLQDLCCAHSLHSTHTRTSLVH